jgi:hypothetical protein
LSYQYISEEAYPKGRITHHVPFFITQPATQKDAGKIREQIIIIIIIIIKQ